ncbi:MAG TPA: hypothetical protein VJ966_07920, partial [Actinomycetes bacterium]|nr:hypothetical protein [Actinomycetes bacterium]
MADPVLLISSDPFLGASLEAVARGRLRVARLDPSRRPVVWPGGPVAATVVLDVTARQRAVLHAWVRGHHPGPLVVLLKPGERAPSLPPDQAQVVIARPFRLGDLVAVLEAPPVPAPDSDPGPRSVPGSRSVPAPGAAEPAPPEGRQEPAPPESGAPAREGNRGGEGTSATVHSPPSPGGEGAPVAVHSPPSPGGEGASVAVHSPPGPGGEGAAVAVHSPPGPGWPTARTRLDVRRRPGVRHRGLVTRVLVGVLVLVVLAVAWLALGLLEARRDLQIGAAGVRDELAAAEAALGDGRTAEA